MGQTWITRIKRDSDDPTQLQRCSEGSGLTEHKVLRISIKHLYPISHEQDSQLQNQGSVISTPRTNN